MNFPAAIFTLSLLMPLILPAQNIRPGMDNVKMEQIIREKCSRVDGVTGAWQVYYKDHILIILSDEVNNRMRIFSPIIEVEELAEGQLEKMMAANFHSALDAKYGIYDDFVVGLYTHPLKELSSAQLEDALLQVVRLSLNFGGSYSSTELLFAPGTQEETPPAKPDRLNKKPDKS